MRLASPSSARKGRVVGRIQSKAGRERSFLDSKRLLEQRLASGILISVGIDTGLPVVLRSDGAPQSLELPESR